MVSAMVPIMVAATVVPYGGGATPLVIMFSLVDSRGPNSITFIQRIFVLKILEIRTYEKSTNEQKIRNLECESLLRVCES